LLHSFPSTLVQWYRGSYALARSFIRRYLSKTTNFAIIIPGKFK
jgi:hypothetical protein